MVKQKKNFHYEEEHLAAVLTGKWLDNSWQGEKKKVDFFVVKGIVEGLFAKLGFNSRVTYVKAYSRRLTSWTYSYLSIRWRKSGFIAQLHPAEQKAS